MATPSAYEQLMLELTNQSRIDPSGEFDRLILDAGSQTGATSTITSAIRFFAVDLNILKSQFDALTAVAPLAWSDQLNESATTHSQLMINFDQQSHNLPGELGLIDRVQATGYQVQSIGENIFLYGEDALSSHAAFFIDWGNTSTGIQQPPGHRQSIMSSVFTEIGIGAIPENNPATQAGPYSITQHIGTSFTSAPHLLGVVINDTDNDDFYDIGEGLSGVTVTATGSSGTFTTTTWGAGGYQLALPDGTYNVTFNGSNVDYSTNVTIAGANVKLDAEADAIQQDSVLSISSLDATKTEGDGGGTTPFLFTVTRTGSTSGTDTVQWQVTNNLSPAADGSDFQGGSFPNGLVTFNAGETSETITVNVIADAVEEVDEYFSIQLSAPSAGATIGTGTANGLILNDDTTSTTSLAQLFSANPDIANGISASYGLLIGGVPNERGYTHLIDTALSTNFGAGPGPIFNAENIFINLVNNLMQGNSTAQVSFEYWLATGNTLVDKITSLYLSIVPPSYRTDEGLAFLLRPDGLAFYQQVALERGVSGTDGAAVIAMASLLKIAVDQEFGIGDAVNDLRKAVVAGSDMLPATSTNVIDIEIADGTQFDGDDATATSAIPQTLAIVGTVNDEMPLLV